MNYSPTLCAAALLGTSGLALGADDPTPNSIQWADNPASKITVTVNEQGRIESSTKTMQGATAEPVSLSAELVDARQKAHQKAATVQVQVSGVHVLDPAASGERPQPGQAHFHYQLDDGPIIATTAPKLSFHELSPGRHTISVVMADNAHRPLGPRQTLSVTIP